MKRRIAAGFLAVVLSLSMVTTTLAADAPKTESTAIAEDVQEEQAETEEVEETQADTDKVQEEQTDTDRATEEKSDEKETDAKEDEPTAIAETSEWTSADFTYAEMSQTLNGCDYTREFTISGIAVSGFSESGAEKIKTNKNLVIPSKDTNGTTIVGVTDGAFKNQGIETLKLPEGMMVDYDDTVTHVVTRRGNFLIGASAFASNKLTSLVLPEGVIFIGPSSFARNNLSYLKIPHTFWWLENSAFAYNNLTTVGFPKTCDFQCQIHAFAFAHNNIKSVRLPDYTEVVEMKAFYWNPGMEDCPDSAPANQKEWGGVVYMYTDNEDLFNLERIHHIERMASSQKSWHQKLVLGEDPNEDTSWTVDDFTYEGTVVTGLSENGIKKRKVNRNLVIPDKTPNGEYVAELASTAESYGLFGAEGEGFDTVTLPARLQKIGNRAFMDNGIQSIEFPGTLKEIGMAAFQQNNLVTIILPDSVTTMGGGAFGSNPMIEKVILSKGLTEIAAGAFGCSDAKNYMTKFTEITIPEGITSIGVNAFAGNNFRNIVIPSTVKSIGNFAFSTKEYLTEEATLTLSEGLETIGNRAFRNKTIKEVTLPSTVKKLPVNAFEKVYSSGEQAVKTKVYVSTEKQYNDKTNFPTSDYHRLVLKLPGMEDQWSAEDFTYGTIEEVLYPAHDTSNKLTIKGTGITGLSKEGESKLEINPDVVIPVEDYDGNTIIGIGQKAFYHKGIKSVTFPSGVMAEYKGDEIAEGLTERGNFIIQANAFAGNELTSIDLPEGVIYVGTSAFNGNKLTTVSMSHTIWHIAAQAFAKNAITTVLFPETCDFKLNIDNMAFGINQIKAVRLPDRTEKVTNSVFFQNTGMEPVSDACTSANYKKGGVVYMYNENVDLTKESFVTHTEGTGTGFAVSGTKSWVQKFVHGEMPGELQPWNVSHFAFDGTAITGFSETGKAKLAAGDTEVELPEKNADGDAVTAIGSNAFAATAMTKVQIPNTVTSIGQAAFRQTALTEVMLPDSVETLGGGAFTNCTAIASVTLSKSMKEVGQSAFNFNTALKSVVIPEGVEVIGRMAFQNAPLTSLSLPTTIKEIGNQAFKGNQLTEIVLPDNVEKLGQSAFSQNVESEGLTSRLTVLTLNEGLKEIGKAAFEKASLINVNLPNSLEKLAKDSFAKGQKGQVKLFTSNKKHQENTKDFVVESEGHIVIYDEVIGTGWTHDDFTYDGGVVTGWSEQGNKTRLSEDIVKEGVRTLVLPSVNPDTLEPITEVGDNAFKIPNGEWEQGKDSVDSPNGMNTVLFPDTLTVIGENAFQYNAIKSLDFPASLMTIKTSAFNSNRIQKLVLPDTITEVQAGAFATNDITELKLSKGVTKIEQGVFSMNIRMEHVEIPDTVTEIGDMAFAGARLTSLEIPASVSKIGRKAFHLHHLTELTIPGTVKEIGDSAFEGTFKAITLKKLTLEEGIETIGDLAFKEGYLETVTIPSTVKSLGKQVFFNNAGTNGDHVVKMLTSNPNHMKIEVDKECQQFVFAAEWTADCFNYDETTVTGFSDKGISYLEYMKDVVIPDQNVDGEDITAIAASAFKDCGITSVVLPENLEEIGEGAFLGNAITKVVLPKKVDEDLQDVFDKAVDFTHTPKDEEVLGNFKFELGSGKDLIVKSESKLKYFKNVTVDGKIIEQSDETYTVKEGSTIVTLKSTYLDTLSRGTHEIAVISKDRVVKANIVVENPTSQGGDSGNTGDGSGDNNDSGNNAGTDNQSGSGGNAGSGNGTGSGGTSVNGGGNAATGSAAKTGDEAPILPFAATALAALCVAGAALRRKKAK